MDLTPLEAEMLVALKAAAESMKDLPRYLAANGDLALGVMVGIAIDAQRAVIAKAEGRDA